MSQGLSVEAALQQVQEGRRMAEPNSSFLEQLLAFERGGCFEKLRAQLLDGQQQQQQQ